jgi:hypothetical protein
MGRFVSLYPGGPAGFALLMLRCSLAAQFVLLADMLKISSTNMELLAAAGLMLALLLGFMTQVAVVAYASIAVFEFERVGGVMGACVLVTGLMAVSLALSGPGAFSIDARLYGRREISLNN